MKQLFDKLSAVSSKAVTRIYSTSFALGVGCLHKSLRDPIHSIYGFVRLADEIVDSFHGYDKVALLSELREETNKAISRGISLNPVINSFQAVVNEYGIEAKLIDSFLNSMEVDLYCSTHSRDSYSTYIFGSAEAVGLMCLRVFTAKDHVLYEKLKPSAMKLGSAFQKVNFLRDMKDDYHELGRIYFPTVDMTRFSDADKAKIEREIEAEFREALEGIKLLPSAARFGVHVAYVYYYALFTKIKSVPSYQIMMQRIRLSNQHKFGLLALSYFRNGIKML